MLVRNILYPSNTTRRVLKIVADMVLEDVTEFDYSGAPTKLPKILLNGNNICMVTDIHREQRWIFAEFPQLIPGGEGPESASALPAQA